MKIVGLYCIIIRVIQMVGILLDPKYSKSFWCKKLYESLVEQLRYKRISFYEIYDQVFSETETVFIIASNRKWIISSIKQLNKIGVHPILISNQSEEFSKCIYSSVCSDINASMKSLFDKLQILNKSKIALYGINTESSSDLSRVDGLLDWFTHDFDSIQIFRNNGSLENCFNNFYSHVDKFDTVICANDFAAISLVKRLNRTEPNKLEKLHIISCAQSPISKYYRNYIDSINLNFEQYGKAAVYVFNAINKHKYISGISLKVLWTFDDGSSSLLTTKNTYDFMLEPSEDLFYDDPELNEMLIVEKALAYSDEIETKILIFSINGYTIDKISELCYLSQETIKYKINKIVTNSGAKNKKELISNLKNYIDFIL